MRLHLVLHLLLIAVPRAFILTLASGCGPAAT